MTRTRLWLVALSLALLAGPPTARAADVDIDKMIEEAKTPADHEAIAAYYDQQADAARAKAAEHQKMGEDYKKMGGALAHKTHFHEHCEALVRSYRSEAKEYAALAAAHREMAKAAKK
ncbi:MAG TPA: hypothetical protein VKW76_01550 [Candidatus Binatia bacterium]|nr:hypothetical protein [Candidatus Binatia bacterium]